MAATPSALGFGRQVNHASNPREQLAARCKTSSFVNGCFVVPLVPLSFAQRAIARGIETWCRAEGICTSRAKLSSFGSAAHAGTTSLLLNLGDTDVLIEGSRVVVRMPHRLAEFAYDPGDEVRTVIGQVTDTVETG